MASTCGVHSRVGPSSTVSATILADGAARNVTDAAQAPGPAGVAVRAVGPSAAAPSQAAIPAPAPDPPPTATRPAPARNPRRSTASHQALSQRRQTRTPPGRVGGGPAALQQHHPAHPPPPNRPLVFSPVARPAPSRARPRSISASRSYSDAERNTLIPARPSDSCLAAHLAAPTQDHLRAHPGQLPRGFFTHAAARSGDQRNPAGR